MTQQVASHWAGARGLSSYRLHCGLSLPLPRAGTQGLQILNAQKEHAGQYTCVVTNELGEAMKNYHVEVLSESGPSERPWDSGRGPFPSS